MALIAVGERKFAYVYILVEELEGIGSGIVASEVTKAPVVLDGAEERVVVVEGAIGGSRLDHRADGDGLDLVVADVVVFVPGDEDEGARREFVESLAEELV